MLLQILIIYIYIAIIIFIISFTYVLYDSYNKKIKTNYRFMYEILLMSLTWPLLFGNVIYYFK